MATRRDKLCLGFANKCLKNSKFAHWFPVRKTLRTRTHFLREGVRSKETKFIEPKWNTKRFLSSSIPHLTRLLNNNV